MPKPAREVSAALGRKGFATREGDHAFYHLYVGGKKTSIYTKISLGEREIHDGLLGAMARQVKLSRHQFSELVDCSLTHDGYVKLLIKGGMVEPPPEKEKPGQTSTDDPA